MSEPLVIHGIAIRRSTSALQSAAGALVRLDLAIDIENTGDQPLHVWATRKDYSYDSATHVLSVHLAEPTRVIPPHIKMISDHPREPTQVLVNATSRITINVQVPAKINRPGPPGGPTWVEEPIGQIDQVQIHIQYGTEPIKYHRGENPGEFRKRLREHGAVVHANITPTIETEK